MKYNFLNEDMFDTDPETGYKDYSKYNPDDPTAPWANDPGYLAQRNVQNAMENFNKFKNSPLMQSFNNYGKYDKIYDGLNWKNIAGDNGEQFRKELENPGSWNDWTFFPGGEAQRLFNIYKDPEKYGYDIGTPGKQLLLDRIGSLLKDKPYEAKIFFKNNGKEAANLFSKLNQLNDNSGLSSWFSGRGSILKQNDWQNGEVDWNKYKESNPELYSLLKHDTEINKDYGVKLISALNNSDSYSAKEWMDLKRQLNYIKTHKPEVYSQLLTQDNFDNLRKLQDDTNTALATSQSDNEKLNGELSASRGETAAAKADAESARAETAAAKEEVAAAQEAERAATAALEAEKQKPWLEKTWETFQTEYPNVASALKTMGAHPVATTAGVALIGLGMYGAAKLWKKYRERKAQEAGVMSPQFAPAY